MTSQDEVMLASKDTQNNDDIGASRGGFFKKKRNSFISFDFSSDDGAQIHEMLHLENNNSIWINH